MLLPLPRDGAASAIMGSTEILGGSLTGASNVSSSMTADDMEGDGAVSSPVAWARDAEGSLNASRLGAEEVDSMPPLPAAAAATFGAGCDLATTACAESLDATGGGGSAAFFSAGFEAEANFAGAAAFTGTAIAGAFTGAAGAFAACGLDSLHFSKSSSSPRPLW